MAWYSAFRCAVFYIIIGISIPSYINDGILPMERTGLPLIHIGFQLVRFLVTSSRRIAMSSQAVSKIIAADYGQVEKNPTYNGQGTEEDPFLVEFHNHDTGNPMNWSQFRKWVVTTIVTLSVFAVTLTSSAYSQSSNEIINEFNISTEIFISGVSLFVLGFAIGPALWGPLVSECPPR